MIDFDQLRPRAVDAAFAAGWSVVPKVPRALSSVAFDTISGLSTIRPGSYQQLSRNLRQVVGPDLSESELQALVRRAVKSYARYWREAFTLPSMSPETVAARTEIVGFDNVQRPVNEGRGAIIALTHSGNWDAAAVMLCKVQHLTMTTVAERLEPASLYERFKRYRESLGMIVVPLTGGPEAATVTLKRALNAGGIITLLGDRDLQHNGIDVELCGRRTTMPTGPALIATQTEADLVPLELSFTETGWRMEYHRPIEVPATGRLRERVGTAIQSLADQFSAQLRRSPQDWHVLQRVWPDV